MNALEAFMWRATVLGLVLVAGCRERAVQAPPAPVASDDRPDAQVLPQVKVTVLFLDEPRFVVGTEPYEVAVERVVPSGSDEAQMVVDRYFQGPTEEETARGLKAITNGLTGARVVREGATVHVHTAGTCATNGAAYNVATLLIRNLKRVEGVRYVKIYDPQGHTQEPTGERDSIPECMEP